MADNVARIRFGVEGGASIREGSGAEIYKDLLSIANQISADDKLKVKFKLDDKSLMQSKAWTGIVEQLQSINKLVDEISKKNFTQNIFQRTGVNISELTKQKEAVRAYFHEIDLGFGQLGNYPVHNIGRGVQAALSVARRSVYEWTASYDKIQKSINESKSHIALQNAIDTLDQYALALTKLHEAASQAGMDVPEMKFTRPEIVQETSKNLEQESDAIQKTAQALKQEGTAVSQNNKELEQHAADVRSAADAEKAKGDSSRNLINELQGELRAIVAATDATSEHAKEMKTVSEFTDQVSGGFADNVMVLNDLRKSLKDLGLGSETIDKISASFNDLHGSIESVDLQWNKGSDGKLNAIRVVTHAVDENNNAFQRQSDFIKRTTKETTKWVETTKAAAKIKFTNTPSSGRTTVRARRTAVPKMNSDEMTESWKAIEAQRAVIKTSLDNAKKAGIENAELANLNAYVTALKKLNSEVSSGKISQEEFQQKIAQFAAAITEETAKVNGLTEAQKQATQATAEQASKAQANEKANRDNAQAAAAWEKLLQRVQTLKASGTQFEGDYKDLLETVSARTGSLDEAQRRYEDLAKNIKDADAATKAFGQSQNILAKSELTYDKLTNKVSQWFHKYESEIKKSPALMSQYNNVLNSLNTKAFGTNMTRAAASVQQFQLACEEAGVTTNTFLKRIISGFGNKLLYGGLAKASAELRRLVKNIYDNVRDLDSAMTQLKIVTGATESQMDQFIAHATQLARELGKSISDVMKSIETFSRLGYSLTDASELAKYATMLSNVAAVDVDTATTGLTSIIKAFNMQVSDSEHVADVLVNVGQKYAISAEELMAAFERGGSALAATNTSFDKAAAIFAAANASMQNAEKVGTAVQTISARIRGAKSELEGIGKCCLAA